MSRPLKIDREHVERLLKSGMNGCEVARELGCTPRSIYYHAYCLHIDTSWTAEKRRKASEWHSKNNALAQARAKLREAFLASGRVVLIKEVCAAKGKRSASEIAAEKGLTRSAVIGIWNRHFDRVAEGRFP